MFLDQSVDVPQIHFSSLMRSGNTFFRRTIETLTGVCTGSNLPNSISLNFALMAQGLKGEQIIDNRVWLIKTHFPYNYPFTVPVTGCTAIALVRNPLDMIVSLFQMAMTLTHNRTLVGDWHIDFAEEWDWAIKQYVNLWRDFYNYWLDGIKNKTLPVYLVRYEDMSTNLPVVMTGVLEFMFGVESISGTYVEQRINTALTSETNSTLYKPRSGGIN